MRMLVILLLAGCSVPKRGGFDDVQKMMRERGAERLHWRLGGPEDDEVDAVVRKLLAEEVTAQSAVQIALLNNPRLQATYERLGVAQADLVQAGLLRNPKLGLHFGLPGLGGPPWSGLAWDLSLIQEFLDLFMMPLRKRFARAELERVKVEVSSDVVEIMAEVRARYFTAMASRQVAQMRLLVLEAAEAAAELARKQEEVGNLPDLDSANEQSAYAQARIESLHAEQRAVADREHLIRLMGVWGRAVGFKLPTSLPEIPKEEAPIDKLEAFAIANRLDLKAARAELDIIRREASLTKATRWIGTIELGGDTHAEPEGRRVIGPTLNLELPIFDQGQARVARLMARFRQARRRVDERAIEIRSQVRETANRLSATRSVADYYRSTVLPLRERIVALSQQRYNAMLIGVYQLLLAKQSEVDTYRTYIESVRDYWIARSDLERVAGGRLPRKGEIK